MGQCVWVGLWVSSRTVSVKLEGFTSRLIRTNIIHVSCVLFVTLKYQQHVTTTTGDTTTGPDVLNVLVSLYIAFQLTCTI